MSGKIDERIVIDPAIGLPAERCPGGCRTPESRPAAHPVPVHALRREHPGPGECELRTFEMLSDLHLGEEVYGWAATFCFYLGYLLFEVPSNLILHRVGARRWISRIMVSWGIVSTCTMFVKDARSFYLVRILLGVAEAGFFPGIVLYLSYWFPARERARAVACFMMASPLSGAFGGIALGQPAPIHRSRLGACGLAMALPDRGDSVGHPGNRDLVVPDGSTERGPMAVARRAVLARRPDGPRGEAQGGAPWAEPPRGTGRPEGRPVHPALLHHRPGLQRLRLLRPEILKRHFSRVETRWDRIPLCDPEPHRRRSPCS